MKKVGILVLILVGVVGIVLWGCTTQKPSEEGNTQSSGDSGVVEKFTAPIKYEELSEGAYIGGTFVYDENEEISQLKAGLIFQLRIDKKGRYSKFGEFEKIEYGFVKIRDIDTSKVILDYLVYDNRGNEIVNRVRVVVREGEKLDLNGDGVANVEYVKAVSDGNDRVGYTNSMHLKFLTSKEFGIRTMVMAMLGQSVPRAKNVVVINPSGKMVVNFSGDNVFETNQLGIFTNEDTTNINVYYFVELDREQYPVLRVDDYLVDKESGTVYLVKGSFISEDKVSYYLEKAKEKGAFEVLYLKVSGALEDIVKKYDPKALDKFSGSTRLWSFNFNRRFGDNNYVEVGLISYGDIIVDGYVSLGWNWGPYAEAKLEAKLKTENNFRVSGRYSIGHTANFSQQVGWNSSLAFWVGGVPVSVGFGIEEVGIDFNAGVSCSFETSLRYVGEAGFWSKARLKIGDTWFESGRINNWSSEVTLPSLDLSGRISVKPYIKARVGLNVSGIEGGLWPTPYVEGELVGTAKVSSEEAFGKVDVNVYGGLSLNAYVGVGVEVFGFYLGKRWDLGRIVDWRNKLFTWTWQPERVTSLDKPILTAVKDEAYGKVSLSWTRVNKAVGFKLIRYGNGVKEKEWDMMTSTNYTDTDNLTTNKIYVYGIYAYNGNVKSTEAQSNIGTFSLISPPTNINVQGLKYGGFRITWSKFLGARMYKVYKYTNNVLEKVFVVSAEEFIDNDLVYGVNYNYAFSAINNIGEGVLSQKTTNLIPPQPDAVSNIRVDRWFSTTSIGLKWNFAEGAKQYVVERIRSNTGNIENSWVMSSNSNYIEDSSLSLDTWYIYRVISVNNAGRKATNSYFLKTPGITLDVVNVSNGMPILDSFTTNLTLNIVSKVSNSPVDMVYIQCSNSVYGSNAVYQFPTPPTTTWYFQIPVLFGKNIIKLKAVYQNTNIVEIEKVVYKYSIPTYTDRVSSFWWTYGSSVLAIQPGGNSVYIWGWDGFNPPSYSWRYAGISGARKVHVANYWNNPLFFVITLDRKLYYKGYFVYQSSTNTNLYYPNWTFIMDNVVDVNSYFSPEGEFWVCVVKGDGSVWYIGWIDYGSGWATNWTQAQLPSFFQCDRRVV